MLVMPIELDPSEHERLWELLREDYPNCDRLPGDEQERLLVMWLNDLLITGNGGVLRKVLGLTNDQFLEIPPGKPKDIHDTAEYWYGVREEVERFWTRRYDPDASEDWS